MSKYHYNECGLQNVVIEGLEPVIDVDGDEVIEIPAINMLHHTIAKGIVTHGASISGAELRFLRTEMGLTQADLAALVHVDKQTVGRWEREETEFEGAPETVIRKLAIEKLVIEYEEGIEQLARSSVKSDEDQEIEIIADGSGYELKSAA